MFFRPFRNELVKLFSTKRTYIGFGVFLVAQNLMLLALYYSRWREHTARFLANNGYLGEDYISALTVAVLMLIPQIALLIPLYTCLVGGDMVAKECEDGTLRMILCRPVSRGQLLRVKWTAGTLFCVCLVVSLGVMAVLFARLWFPWMGLFIFAPVPRPVFAVLAAGEGLRLYAATHLILALNACTMFTLAFMFSCWNMKPAAATVLALSFLILNLVMEIMPFFEEYKELSLTYHMKCWLLVFQQPLPWPDLLASVSVILGVNVSAYLVGATVFHMRDLKA